MHFVGGRLSIEEFQPGTHDLLYGIYDRRKNLVGHNYVRLTGQTAFQRRAPRDPQFGIEHASKSYFSGWSIRSSNRLVITALA
jgi:hypothetical protein